MTKEEYELVDMIITIVEEIARLKAENAALRRMIDILIKEKDKNAPGPL